MAVVLQPWQLLVASLAGWLTRQQDAVIDYLREENRVLRHQLGRRRLRLTDDQRRRLAVRGKAIGRRALKNLGHRVGRNLTDPFDGFLAGKSFLIIDRDSKYSTLPGFARFTRPGLMTTEASCGGPIGRLPSRAGLRD